MTPARWEKTLRSGLLIALVATALVVPTIATANTPACCLPTGTCEDLLPMQCDDRDGISLVGLQCDRSPCEGKMAPVASIPALLATTAVLLAFAIYSIVRRSSRE